MSPTVDKTLWNVYCHNWLRLWLKKSKKRRATWLVPNWSYGMFELPKDMSGQVEVIRSIENLKVDTIDRVYICRSGCWTPPWLDRKFIDFVNARGEKVVGLQDGNWDPMIERWTEEELRHRLEQDQQMQETLKTMRVGSISSKDFVMARVEHGFSS